MSVRASIVRSLLCLCCLFIAGCGGTPTPAVSEPTTAAVVATQTSILSPATPAAGVASPATTVSEPTAVAAVASPTTVAALAPSATAVAATPPTPTVGPLGEGTPRTGEVATFCGANEEPVLSCLIAGSDKVLSVCASTDLAQGGYLQYRFGSGENVELAYPQTLTRDAVQAFRYSRSTGSGTDYLYLSFEENDHIFRVYQLDNNGNRVAGVDVRDPQGQVIDFPCDPDRIERLIMLEGIVPEGIAGQESSQAPTNSTGRVVVTFGELPPYEMPVVYLHEVTTGAFYTANMPIGAGLNQVTFDEVAPGRYQVYARSTAFEDISYWGYWQAGGALEVITVEAGQEQSQPTLSAPTDPCAAAYQLPASPDGVYPATDIESLAVRRGCSQ